MVELGNRVKTTSKSGAVLLGTVKFVGKHHTKGEDRVGIELDDPVGKHNGTVKVRVNHCCTIVTPPTKNQKPTVYFFLRSHSLSRHLVERDVAKNSIVGYILTETYTIVVG